MTCKSSVRMFSGQHKSGIIPLTRLPALYTGDEVGDNTACLVPDIQEFLSTLQTGSYRAALLFPFHRQEGP